MEEEKDRHEEENEVFEEDKENFKKDIESHRETEKAKKAVFEDEIETEWASALHIDFDPEEARQRAEKASTPPPVPGNLISPVPASPQPPMQPLGYQNQPQQQDTPQPYNQEEMPETYLVWSVLATVFCCLIPGIVAIVYSTMVSSKYYAKDYDGARKASQMAQYWIIASVVLGVITAAVYIPLSLFA